MSRPKRRALQVLLAGCLSAAAIAGCGSSSAPTTASTNSTKTTASTALANEAPAQILKRSATALEKAGTFRMQGTLTQVGAPKKFMRVSLAVYSPRELEMAVTENAGRLAVILDGRRAYLRADDRFWAKASHGGAGSALFANHWFLFPAATADKLSKSLGPMTPSYMARCMVEQTGKVTLAGRTTVDHRSAVVLRSAASGPGQQSERIAVALDGPPYPLQLSARGKPLPGHAKAGPCDSCGSGPAQVGTVTMSDFGRVGKLHVPKHAPTVLEFARHAAAVHLA